ncbi:hypothetical protein Tco_0058588 [Tanacetum coccineum]
MGSSILSSSTKEDDLGSGKLSSKVELGFTTSCKGHSTSSLTTAVVGKLCYLMGLVECYLEEIQKVDQIALL